MKLRGIRRWFRIISMATMLYSMWEAGVKDHLRLVVKDDPLLNDFYNQLVEFFKLVKR